MKTDRELIELAAKAAGLTVMWSEPFKRYERFVLEKYAGPWDPINDDGDALRLATALRISIIRDSPNVQAVADQTGERKTKIQEDVLYQCKHDATRRVIVRAAAAIGGQL